MTTTVERQLRVQAWMVSVTMHGIAVTLAVLFVSQIKPLASQETFQWNASLVEGPQQQAVEPGVQAARPPAPPRSQTPVQPMQPMTTTPHMVVREVQTRQPNSVVQREQPQPFEAPNVMERSPVQAMAEPAVVQQRQDPVSEILPSVQEASVQETQPFERLSDAVVQSVASVETPSRVGSDAPVLHAVAAVGAPVAETKESDTRPVTPPKVASGEAPVDFQPVQTVAVTREWAAPHVSAERGPSMTNAVQQSPAARADYGWLIDSIGRRLAELKRYPSTARLNGWEGKVVLRAVIRADGNLAEVTVQKSSGYEELDAAAMEVLRQACPLDMRHELGRPDIVVNIPLNYALSR